MMESTVRQYHTLSSTIELGHRGFVQMFDYIKSAHIYQVDCVAFVLFMGLFIVGTISLLDKWDAIRCYILKIFRGAGRVEKCRKGSVSSYTQV